MAKLKYIGAATAKQQITTVTISGTWAAGETVTLKVAEKEVVYTATGSPTPSSVALGLQLAAAASSDPEFKEATWSVNSGVVTATGSAGIPLTITASETAASGSVAVSTTQSATGPYHWDNADNWSTGSVPTTSDEVYFESDQAIARYGLPTSLTLAKLYVRRGSIGLPERATGGYHEYRAQRAIITCTDVQIGMSPGVGPALCRLDLSTAAAVVAVWGSSQRADSATVDLLLNSASSEVNVLSGQVWVAVAGEETSTVGSVRVAQDATVVLGPGVTATTVLTVGTSTIWASPTNLTVYGGSCTIAGSAAVSGTTVISAGTLVHKSSGTLASVTVGPGTIDFSQDLRAKTVTALTLKNGGIIRDPYVRATFTTFSKGADSQIITAS
jgi:hypothetical protein